MKNYSVVLAALFLPAAVFGANAAAQTVKPALKPAVKTTQTPAENLKFKFDCKVSKPDGIFKKGEEIVFTGKAADLNKEPKGKFFRAQLLFNGKLKERKILPISEEITFKTSSQVPGWFYLELVVMDEKKVPITSAPNGRPLPFKGGIGAMVAPDEILPGAPEPADFDEFWKKQRAELDKVPLKAVLTEVEVPKNYKKKVRCWDVKVDCAGGMPVSGYLCMPVNAKPKSLPIQVTYHGAGVRSANKPLSYGQYAIVFDVNAHGIVNGQPKEFYNKLSANELRGYSSRNKKSRDDFYFRGMFLRIMRSLDYVKSLPEWNGKVLIVSGGSQGGAQALAAAALEPQVTYCGASVPALCDHGGSYADREAGWPRLYNIKRSKGKDADVAKAVQYYDCCYFAKRIKCEVFICTGFYDTVCVPTSVYAAYNSIPESVKKFLYTQAAGTHSMWNSANAKRIRELLNIK